MTGKTLQRRREENMICFVCRGRKQSDGKGKEHEEKIEAYYGNVVGCPSNMELSMLDRAAGAGSRGFPDR